MLSSIKKGKPLEFLNFKENVFGTEIPIFGLKFSEVVIPHRYFKTKAPIGCTYPLKYFWEQYIYIDGTPTWRCYVCTAQGLPAVSDWSRHYVHFLVEEALAWPKPCPGCWASALFLQSPMACRGCMRSTANLSRLSANATNGCRGYLVGPNAMIPGVGGAIWEANALTLCTPHDQPPIKSFLSVIFFNVFGRYTLAPTGSGHLASFSNLPFVTPA